MCLSPLGYALVYAFPPKRDSKDGGWSRRGELFYFSPRDARWFGFTEMLDSEHARVVRLVPAGTGSRWYFTRRTDGVIYLSRLVGLAWTRAQPFCERFLKAVGYPDLAVGETLSVVFE